MPKTIDNDLAGTDFTFGFQTAVQIATDAIDRLHTTAESHNRVIVVEVMGRHAGWIACYSGMAGGADVILVPERPFDLDEICERLRRRQANGATFSIVVVAEGATPKDGGAWSQHEGTDAFGHARLGGIAVELEREIEARTGFESRMTILGHVQRGGTPLAYDRVLGTRFGVAAIDAVSAGNFGDDDRAARHRDQARPARRGARRAQAAGPGAVRDGRGVLRLMFKQGPIPAFVHGLIEYVAGALFIAAPFLFTFDSGTATAVSIVAGVLVLVVAASTDMSTGLIKSIPVQAHVVLDYALALLLIASPFVFGFSGDGTATAFFIVLGVAHLLITIATRFVRSEPQRRRPAEDR